MQEFISENDLKTFEEAIADDSGDYMACRPHGAARSSRSVEAYLEYEFLVK
jgi:hypothetical protein